MLHEQDNKCLPLSGFYEESTGEIFINESLGKYAREIVWIHENKHRECHQNNCCCWGKSTNYLAELHAYKFELQAVLERKDRRLAKAYFDQIEHARKVYSNHKESYDSNYRALKRIMTTRAFKELSQWFHDPDRG